MLFYTGIRRSASDVLAIETAMASAGAPADLTANLDAVKALGLETLPGALEAR